MHTEKSLPLCIFCLQTCIAYNTVTQPHLRRGLGTLTYVKHAFPNLKRKGLQNKNCINIWHGTKRGYPEKGKPDGCWRALLRNFVMCQGTHRKLHQRSILRVVQGQVLPSEASAGLVFSTAPLLHIHPIPPLYSSRTVFRRLETWTNNLGLHQS